MDYYNQSGLASNLKNIKNKFIYKKAFSINTSYDTLLMQLNSDFKLTISDLSTLKITKEIDLNKEINNTNKDIVLLNLLKLSDSIVAITSNEVDNKMYIYDISTQKLQKVYLRSNYYDNNNLTEFSFKQILNLESSSNKILIKNENNISLFSDQNINNSKIFCDESKDVVPKFYVSYDCENMRFYLWQFTSQIIDKNLLIKLVDVMNVKSLSPQDYLLSIGSIYKYLVDKTLRNSIYENKKLICYKITLLYDSNSSCFILLALIEDLIYMYRFQLKKFNNSLIKKDDKTISDTEMRVICDNSLELLPAILETTKIKLPQITLNNENSVESMDEYLNFSSSHILDFSIVKLDSDKCEFVLNKEKGLLNVFSTKNNSNDINQTVLPSCQVVLLNESTKNNNFLEYNLVLANLSFLPKGTNYELIKSTSLKNSPIRFSAVNNKFIALLVRKSEKRSNYFYSIELLDLPNLSVVCSLNLNFNITITIDSKFYKMNLIDNGWIIFETPFGQIFLISDIENFYDYFKNSTKQLGKSSYLTFKTLKGRELISKLKHSGNTVTLYDKNGFFLILPSKYVVNFVTTIVNK